MSKVLSSITFLLVVCSYTAFGFSSRLSTRSGTYTRKYYNPICMSQNDENTPDDGVIELADLDESSSATGVVNVEEGSKEAAVAPFLSQGEIQEETLKVDLTDPKQTRVIIYIILSLLPVLFLIPLMLGSREFLPAIIPMDELPPVQM